MKYQLLSLPTEILTLILLHLSDDEDLRNLRDAFTVLSSHLTSALVPAPSSCSTSNPTPGVASGRPPVSASAPASVAREKSSSPTTAIEVNGSSATSQHVYESTAISPAPTHRPAAATARATATATSTPTNTLRTITAAAAQVPTQRQIKNLQLAIDARLSDLRADQLRTWHDTVRKRVMWPFYGARGGSGGSETKAGVVR